MFYISSYFWDRAQDVGLIPNDKVRHLLSTPSRILGVLWVLLAGLLDCWLAVSRERMHRLLEGGQASPMASMMAQAISVVISPVAFREKGDLACRTPMTSLGSEFASVGVVARSVPMCHA